MAEVSTIVSVLILWHRPSSYTYLAMSVIKTAVYYTAMYSEKLLQALVSHFQQKTYKAHPCFLTRNREANCPAPITRLSGAQGNNNGLSASFRGGEQLLPET